MNEDSIPQAVEQSHQMAIKLKHIRAILGYQNKPTHKTLSRPVKILNDSRKEDKSASIKNFVVLMRKKKESEGFLSHRRK